MDQLDDLLLQIVGGVAVILLVWILGLPKKIATKIHARYAASKLSRTLRQGPFDSATIDRSVRYYVQPMCSTTDPSVEAEPAQALITPRESLFQVLDRFLEQKVERKKHLLLLADSGMGKTSFLLNYFAAHLARLGGQGAQIQLISLADPGSNARIEGVAAEVRHRTHIFLDALDEDHSAYGRVRERVAELVLKCHDFRSVVLTCRTQFFSADDEIPIDTGLFKTGPVPINESKMYRFKRLYLSPFDDQQIERYLQKRYPGLLNLRTRGAARGLVRKVPALSVRPMLLAHLPDIMSSRQLVQQPIDVYAAMVDAWLRRESFWVEPATLKKFSELLSLELYLGNEARGGEAASPAEIQALAISWGIDLDPKHLTSRSLLNRTSDGNYKFAHRSILEFFVAEQLIEGKVSRPIEITDQIAQFVTQRLGCWSPSFGKYLSYNKVVIERETPEARLGFLTMYGIYGPSFEQIFVTKLMDVRTHKFGSNFCGYSLSHALIECIEVAANQGGGKPVEAFLRFEDAGERDRINCFCAVWHEKNAALVKLVLDKAHLLSAFSSAADFDFKAADILVQGRYTKEGFDEWTLRKRVELPLLIDDRASIAQQLALNPSVALRQSSPEDILTIRFFGRFDLASEELVSFGILGDELEGKQRERLIIFE